MDFATARAPSSAWGSVCVIRVEMRIKALRRASVLCWAQKRPMTDARMAGPLPAENTPERSGEMPTSNFKQACAVAFPTPGAG